MKRKINLKEKFEKLENFLFDPHTCICCKGECDLDNHYRLCSKCIEKIDFIDGNFCLKCGDKISDSYDFCINCKENSYNFDYARAVFCYNEVSAPIILTFKYNGQKIYAKPLAHLLYDYIQNSDLVYSEVTFVPMPKQREKERGYNQAYELAKEFCLLDGRKPISTLVRKEDNIKQTTLSATERFENIKDSFVVINKGVIKNKDFLLIDDVSTTGATSSACAKALKDAGARSVCVLTVAKTTRN